MKIYKDVLSQDLLNECVEELHRRRTLPVWKSSLESWNQNVLENIRGDCLSSIVEQPLKDKIETELSTRLPDYNNLTIQLYIWQPNSGISFHNDQGYKFGATLYLNNLWAIDNGGFFVWQDLKSKELKIQLPECNTLIVNDNKEWHLVTPVGTNVKESRYTLQIWGF